MKSLLFLFIGTLSVNAILAQSMEFKLVPKGTPYDSTTAFSIAERMAFYKVPGLSITVFENGKIVSDSVYGLAGNVAKINLLKTSRFQAASISKPLTALAILRLTKQHNLDLDRDINDYLKTWKVPGSRFTEKEKVTIRRLLNHTAGINVGGFGGYKKGETIPTLIQILDGKGNSPAIKVTDTPGKKYLYSGGGYLILQQLVEDITSLPFADYMQKEILIPMGMYNSSFELEPAANISLAHDNKGQPYPGGWFRMPEFAAAGLWTTGADLARFCMAMQQAYDGEEHGTITPAIAKEMLTAKGSYGLGMGIGGAGTNVYFYHGGKNRGFNNVIFNLYLRGGLGIIILTNADQGDQLRDEILRSFARQYNVPQTGH